ncbi:MAG: response regulator [Betaproteobacteria bacterium]|nr:response regulator [Betaproteobacteria bacterium]
MAKDLERILYVEDEADIQTIAVTVLETIGGFTIVACRSGSQAIEAAPVADADLILLDVMMPGMDGPTTLRKLRDIPQTATTPAVFMTAKVQASEIEYFKSLGALDVIPKPFDPMKLPEQINEIWRRSAGTQAPAPPGPKAAGPQSAEEELQALYRRYAAQLPGTIEEIEILWTRIASGADPSALKSLHRALHSLAGSGATFGFSRMGSGAKAMELALVPYLPDAAIPPAMQGSLSLLLEAIKRAAVAPDTPV